MFFIKFLKTERARTRKGKIGPVDLSKNENEYVWKSTFQQMDPCWFHVCSYDVNFKTGSWIMTSLIASSSPKYNFCDENSKIITLFFQNSHMPQPPIQFW